MFLTPILATALCLSGCGGGTDESETSLAAAVPEARLQILSTDASAAADASKTPQTIPAAGSGIPVTVRIRAAGTSADGQGARVTVRLNGLELASGELHHEELVDYVLDLPPSQRTGVLDIVLTNATDPNGTTRRPLRIDRLAVDGFEMRPTDAGVSFDAGEGDAAFDGLGLSSGVSILARNGALRITLPGQVLAPAAGVYVDAQRGDDSQSGTVSQPWRTLQRLQRASLLPSQAVFLRCDGHWRESLTLDSSRLVNGQRFATYGPECVARQPVISGADNFSGQWQKDGNLWHRKLPAGTPKISQLAIDGHWLRTAAWESGSSSSGTAAAVTGVNGRLVLNAFASSALVGKDLIDALIHVRTQNWFIESRRVRTATGNQIELDNPTLWPATGGKPFTLQDKRWMLDQAGEFFHDTVAQKLYLITPVTLAGADVNGRTVEGSVRDTGVSLTGRAALDVSRWTLLSTRDTGLVLHNTPGSRVEGVQVSHNGRIGLRLSQWPRDTPQVAVSTVAASQFLGNGQWGIDATETELTLIEGNTVSNTGTGWTRMGGAMASISNGPGGKTLDNRISNGGYHGINFFSRRASIVAGNDIQGVCQRLSDCGGIYTWSAASAAIGEPGATIERNRVALTPEPGFAGQSEHGKIIVGIYIDDRADGVTVRDNLLRHGGAGVFVHNASQVTVSSNRIWQAGQVGLWASMDRTDIDLMKNNIFIGNTIVPALAMQGSVSELPRVSASQPVWFWHELAGAAALAGNRNRFESNRVVLLHGATADYAWIRGAGTDRIVDADTWKAQSPAELAPELPAHYEPAMLQLGEELVVDGQFASGLSQWLEHREPGGVGGMSRVVNGAAGCEGACVEFTAGSRGDLLGSRSFVLRAGAVYLYSLAATMPVGAPATINAPYISRSVTPWDQMSDVRGFVTHSSRSGVAGQTLRYGAFFRAKVSAEARVNLMLETLRTPVHFDAISVREVRGFELATPEVWSVHLTAPRDRPRSVDCAGLGWGTGCAAMDLSGQPVTLPFVLDAGGERLLLRADSSWRR